MGRHDGGLGLGLVLVRRLTELHGGTVEVLSDGVGCGPEFRVLLPACADVTVKHEAKPRDTLSSARRVLVVHSSDSPDAEAFAAILRSRGDRVHTASGNITGVSEGDRLKPHIVLLDGGFDGYEACRLIREQPWGRMACVIARAVAANQPEDQTGGDRVASAAQLSSLIDRLVGQAISSTRTNSEEI